MRDAYDGKARLDAEWSTLMVAAQAGDRVAYERLLRACVPFIRRFLRGYGVQPDRVNDITQETLLIVHRGRHTYDPSRSFSAWLCAIAQCRATDNLPSRERLDRREVFSPIAHKNRCGEKDDLARKRGQSVGEALNELPPGQQESIEALALLQLSLEEALKLTGTSKGAWKVSMHRAFKMFRTRFGREP